MFKIYDITDFKITIDMDTTERRFRLIRAGELANVKNIPPIAPGQSENFWHILACGDCALPGLRLYSFEHAILEHFTAAIYRLVLGYAADTLIVYDPNEGIFCRASRNITDANTWGPNNSLHGSFSISDPIDNYKIQADGSLLSSDNKKYTLHGLAAIAVTSFLLGDGDVHSAQYLLQDLPQPKVWKIDHQCTFRATYPISIENLEALPYFTSDGYMKRYCMDTNLSRLITDSEEFKQEKLHAIKILFNSQAELLNLLDRYCMFENYDISRLNAIFSPTEVQQLPEHLNDIKRRFSEALGRLCHPTVKEYLEKNSVQVSKPKIHM